MKAPGNTAHVNNGNKTGTDMFGNGVFFNDSPVPHGSRNERNCAVDPGIHHYQDISAAGSVSGYTGRRASGRQGGLSSYHDRLALVAQRLPVEDIGVIARAVGEAVF